MNPHIFYLAFDKESDFDLIESTYRILGKSNEALCLVCSSNVFDALNRYYLTKTVGYFTPHRHGLKLVVNEKLQPNECFFATYRQYDFFCNLRDIPAYLGMTTEYLLNAVID